MPDRSRLVRAKVANVVALVVIFALTAALIASEAARARNQREVRDYVALLGAERVKVRRCVIRRLATLEGRVISIPNKGTNNVYQDRLADVRRRFVVGMRWPDAPACPKPLPVPAAIAAPRVDEPACPFSEEEAVNARQTAQQLAALQAWVRENMGEVK